VSRPTAWIVDVDGTLALPTQRNPYDWRRASDDLPNIPVIITIQSLAMHPSVDSILAISGREENARTITEQWLSRFGIPCEELFMRTNGDYRPDEIIKEEIYANQIRNRYSVAAVIDDRDRVVRMWRRNGLVCFQVADGNF